MKDLKLSLTVACPSCGNLISVTTAADGQTAVCQCKNQTPQPPLGGANPATVSGRSVVGTIRMTKAAKRLQALMDAGFNTDGYAALNIKGIDAIVRTTSEGSIEMVADDDPIFAKIKVQGYTYSPRMFKQWVMAQLLANAWVDSNGTGNVDNNKWRKWMREQRFYSTDVVLKLLCDKQLEIAAAKRNGDATIADDERWYNKQMYVDYLRITYMKALRQLLDHYIEHHKCKGVEYVRVPDIDRVNKKAAKNYKGTFIADLDEVVYKPLNRIVNAIEKATDPYRIYKLLCDFRKHAVIVYHRYSRVITYKQDGKKVTHRNAYPIDITGKAFENAFTGYGVFFTMQNMIRFHGCTIKGCSDAQTSEAKLNEWAKKNEISAWWLWGALKQFIDHNSFDFRAKQTEWRNK